VIVYPSIEFERTPVTVTFTVWTPLVVP